MKKFKSVDHYIEAHMERRDELKKIRKILLSSELKETTKWGLPVYTYNDKNIVGMGSFKSYTGIWFFQGALLKDPYGILVNAQEGKTKALRQMRFNSIEEIEDKIVREYIKEAIANQKKGKEIKPSRNKPLIVPRELKKALDRDPLIKSRFNELSLSCRREYAEYISEAKRDETKLKRLEKIIPMILDSKGLNDKYK
jgi:uncharacterized protein YdeI (YjbR/CyaY-like superfamily)